MGHYVYVETIKLQLTRPYFQSRTHFPRVEELVTALAGGKTYSKLDLSNAYLQLPLDKQSKEYLTINTH